MAWSPWCGLSDNHLSPLIFQLPLEITPLLCWQSNGSFISRGPTFPSPMDTEICPPNKAIISMNRRPLWNSIWRVFTFYTGDTWSRSFEEERWGEWALGKKEGESVISHWEEIHPGWLLSRIIGRRWLNISFWHAGRYDTDSFTVVIGGRKETPSHVTLSWDKKSCCPFFSLSLLYLCLSQSLGVGLSL